MHTYAPTWGEGTMHTHIHTPTWAVGNHAHTHIHLQVTIVRNAYYPIHTLLQARAVVALSNTHRPTGDNTYINGRY